MAIDNVQTNTQVDNNGNSYTSSVSNDKLTNDDFLNLMIQELKMQDPTKPMDSDRMMDNQLKMSTIEANLDMTKSMEALKASYQVSSLSTAANLIGHIVEDGQIGDDGLSKSYKVDTIESSEGELYANVKQMIGLSDNIEDSEGNAIDYDTNGFIYIDGEKTEQRLAFTEDGRVLVNSEGNVALLDEDGEIIEENADFNYAGSSVVYGDIETLPLSSIVKVR
ncbi:MAG: flagellar hook capping FlgD N-terminal domain-containing protein [Campylobacterota bacterium]|nr:flagellar hook capping FlgD N-terminal domain-containing protein [Campylobacterota bacterium]